MDYEVTHGKATVTFTPAKTRAKVLMVPFATDANLIETVLKLKENQHHAWGVKELLMDSIEVSVIRRYNDLLEKIGQDWSLPNSKSYDLIYSNHNRLVRSPIESLFGMKKTPLVSLVYAGEPLCLPKQHFGILGMTPSACRRFAHLDTVDVRYTPWGIDPESALHQQIEPSGEHFISTGVTHRDFTTLFEAATRTDERIVIAARGQNFPGAPSNAKVLSENRSPWDIREFYKGAIAGLVILERDDPHRTAVGWTNILELMAVGLPIIKTRTGALDEILDLEKIGAGILVAPEKPGELASAMQKLRENPQLCQSMGRTGAAYVREHLTMQQFANSLIQLVDDAKQQS